MQVDTSLQLILADFIGDDEINCSIFPPEQFGIDPDAGVTDAVIDTLGEFNLVLADRNVVALPSYVQGMSGVFIAKLDVELSDNDREVYAMFLEPVKSLVPVERLHYEALVTLLDTKV